ncbi:hypothetical protein [Anaeromyxobacter dehalogenans]|uniref:HNH endonuclease 5 domain-containing protein n=1 Tax=Anaeromyxobacter dehalogenans (strain 2CP-C) TaxID=290397 RepID=Q2IFE6_ANADE|nr:hypothetical protein [Anaeromyxobacter dehalogenans]ABC83307.1 hypothetical protein Adeh_3541 [Anaeromyxobacter dehalogenans 2CP-C]
MEQVKPFSDDRIRQACVYCGGAIGTRDHVPSRVLLDEPFPDNLPVVDACSGCNSGFSDDEMYVACLVDVVQASIADPDLVPRKKIGRILREQTLLRDKLARARHVNDGVVSFDVESARVRNVLLKLARGHAAFELDERRRGEPVRVTMIPLAALAPAARAAFETPPLVSVFPEVGSRAMQRMSVASVTLMAAEDPSRAVEKQLILGADWIQVQRNRYRYLAVALDSGELVVRIVLSEYLCCEVIWN